MNKVSKVMCSCPELFYGERFANCTKFAQLILSNIIKIVTIRSHILRL